jgi:hypothetical protein
MPSDRRFDEARGEAPSVAARSYPHHRRPRMNTRTIAVVALIIAVIVLLLLLL